MPKNENGQIVCVNHPEKELQILNNVALPVFDSQSILQNTNQNFVPVKARFCNECGYIEFQTLHQDEFPEEFKTLFNKQNEQ